MGINRIAVASLVLSAVCSASASAADSGTCPPLQGVILHLKPTDSGYLLPVSVAGVPKMFLLDLGSAYSKLDEATTTELNLPLRKAPIVVWEGGSKFAQSTVVPSLKIGPVMRGDSEIFVGARPRNWGNADGVAGMNMFSGFDVELDLAHNHLGLYLPRDCSFRPFWPSDVFGEAQFILEKTGRIILPMKLDGIEIEADLRMREQQSTIPQKAAEILYDISKDDSRLTPTGKDGYGPGFSRFPFKTLTAGDKITVDNPQIFLFGDGKETLCSGVAGRKLLHEQMRAGGYQLCFGGGDIGLSTNLLRQLHLFFAFKDKTVYFTAAEPSAQTASPETKDQYDAAIADYNQLLRLKPDDANVLNDRGDAYQAKGQYDAAIADYSKAISLTPDLALAFNARGDAYQHKGQYDAAIADYSKAISLKPDDANVLKARGDAYQHKGQYDAAIADYSQVIRLKPNDAFAFIDRGDAYRHKGQYDSAIADYSQAISLKPDFGFASFFRGMAYFKKGQDDAAIADYGQFIRLKPDFAFAFDARGDAYQHKGQYDAAIADYSRAISLKPDDATAFDARGNAYQYKGQYDAAIADYSRAISLKPDDAIAFNARCWTRALAGQQLDEALADCNKSLHLRPNDANVLDSRGFVYFRMGNYPAAMADYNAALAGNPKSASSFFVRGLTKQKLGDTAGGDDDIAAAKKLDHNIAEEYAKYGVTQR